MVGEQAGVHAVGVARAVLIVLDAHQSGLCRPVQPGDHPSLGVGLLEVVERPVHHVLAQLPERAVAAQVPRRAAALDRLDEQGVEFAHHALRRPVARGHVGA